MNRQDILEILKKTDALLSGHFQLSSALHSEKYIQCALALQVPEYSTKLCAALAEKFKADKPTVVIGPALGGVIVSYESARSLGARSLFTERENGAMVLRRGFSIDKSDRILVVEDVITTGGSVKEVMGLIAKTGASIVGLGSIVDRSGGKAAFDCRFESLIKIDIDTFKPEACPMCKSGSKAIKPGSRIITVL